MTVYASPAMTGYMLDDGQDGAFDQPFAHGIAEANDASRVASVSSVTNYRIGAFYAKVENRQTIDGYPESAKIIGDQPRGKKSGFLCDRIGQGSEPRSRRIEPPMRWPQPCDPAALLVDQNRRIVTTNALSQGSHQLTNLIGRATIPSE
jgi:hypothetical protein